MNYENLPDHLIGSINPKDVRTYAASSGWKRTASINGKVAVFTDPGSDLDQLLIPLDASVSDYNRRMAEVVVNLAAKEGRPALEVLNDLLLLASDVLRFRLEEPEAQSGVIPLNQGIDLLAGARKAILAAACSVVQPQVFHPRLSRAEAEQLVQACRLGQTETGSFTAVIACPLNVGGPVLPPSQPLPLFEGKPGALGDRDEEGTDSQPAPEPFTRKVTALLMHAIARIVTAVDSDDVQNLASSGVSAPAVSANLCDALIMMQPMGDRSRLLVSAAWSKVFLPPPSTAPNVVHLRREHFSVIATLASALRPAHQPKPSMFVGLVDALFGDPDEDGRVSGEVQLLIINQEEVRRARINLGPKDYHKAWEAHGVGGYVQLYGILVLGDRVHRIENVSNFKFLKD
jgi:hypothetical protein